jgi:predicted MFS family arabinose efflux permease
MAALLYRVLPEQSRNSTTSSYPDLLRSMLALLIEEPVVRLRALFAFLIFATFSTFWTSMVLPLGVPPFDLSHTQIGLFGLAGLVGALAAGKAGHLADRGFAQWTTGLSLLLMFVAWVPIAFLGVSLWPVIGGVILLDLAIQTVHVTNLSLIFAVRPEAQSRLVAGYMVFYSLGSAVGSASSTFAYAQAGWSGVCVLGAALSGTAFLIWGGSLYKAVSAKAACPAGE